MCGIFGIVARNARIPDGVLERGTQSLAHRGPDDSGTILVRDSIPEPVEIGLGNRRLAILDLSALAHQPMHDAETGNWIVYNGEIYNFRDVRHELEQAGAKFATCLPLRSGMPPGTASSLPGTPWASSRSTMLGLVRILFLLPRSARSL